MATITKRGEGSTGVATELVITLATGIVAGHRAIVVCASNKDPDAANGIASVADSAGNTWGARDIGGADATVKGLAVFSCHLTASIADGGTVTITYTGSSAGWKGIVYDLDSSISGGSDESKFTDHPFSNNPSATADNAVTVPCSVFFVCSAGTAAAPITTPTDHTLLDDMVDGFGNTLKTSWIRYASGTPTAIWPLSVSGQAISCITAYPEGGTSGVRIGVGT